ARHIDGEAIEMTTADRLDNAAGHAFERTREPGAQERVDHQLALAQQRGRGIGNLATPLRAGLRGLAAKPGAVAQQAEPDGAACLLQPARGDEAIAAIVSRPAQNESWPPRPAPQRLLSDGGTGTFH